MSQPTKELNKKFDSYECGPRPPVPGEESQMSKMTTECASNSTSSLNSNRSHESDSAFTARIEKWQESFSSFLDDEEGVSLLLKFVKEESGENSINSARLKFYFAVRGLKTQQLDEKKCRKLIKLIR